MDRKVNERARQAGGHTPDMSTKGRYISGAAHFTDPWWQKNTCAGLGLVGSEHCLLDFKSRNSAGKCCAEEQRALGSAQSLSYLLSIQYQGYRDYTGIDNFSSQPGNSIPA